MPKAEIDIGTGFYQSEARPLANTRCVNAYVENTQTKAVFQNSVFGTPGLFQIATTGVSPDEANRGAWVKEGVPYFVNGESIYRLDRSVNSAGNETFTTTNLGTIEGESRCSFADNGTELLVLVPGGKGYIVDENNTPVVQEITDADFTTTNGKPQYVVYINGYFVVSTDEDKFKWSAINAGFTWSALDFTAALVDPDDIVAPFVFKNELFIAGTQTIETFDTTADIDNVFQRVDGFVIQKGCLAPQSIQVFNETVFWIGQGENEGAAVWQLQGSAANKISTFAIDNLIQGLTTEQQKAIFSWAYSQGGHYFVGFTSERFTVVYDMATGLWHERESQITDAFGTTTTNRSRYNSIVNAYGRSLCGDSVDGRIGELSREIYKEYNEALVCYFTTSPLFNLGDSFTIPSIEIMCQPGVGNTEKTDPVVNFRVSKDGYIFNDYRTVKLGKAGEYNKRQIFRHIGRANRYAIFEFLISDPVQRRFMGLVINYNANYG